MVGRRKRQADRNSNKEGWGRGRGKGETDMQEDLFCYLIVVTFTLCDAVGSSTLDFMHDLVVLQLLNQVIFLHSAYCLNNSLVI